MTNREKYEIAKANGYDGNFGEWIYEFAPATDVDYKEVDDLENGSREYYLESIGVNRY